jgi:hypothetical protein
MEEEEKEFLNLDFEINEKKKNEEKEEEKMSKEEFETLEKLLTKMKNNIKLLYQNENVLNLGKE